MEGYLFRIHKVAFLSDDRFNKLLRALLCISIFICTGSLLTSCATGSRETYLKKMNLSGISKVAIVASVSFPKVSYAKRDNVSLNLYPIAGLFPILAEAAIRSGVDHGHAGDFRQHVDFSHFEETVAQSFMQTLKKGDCFQAVEYFTDKNRDSQQFSAKGYDAVIHLFVSEITLKRVAGDDVGLDAFVRGQMEHFSSGKVVWDRGEYVMSPEIHPLNYYKENGLKELDAMLEKAGRNLAYDFVYLK